MPKLLAFLPCEKVIVDESQNASLINLLSSLVVAVPPEKPAPADAMLPVEWAALTLWKPVSGDEGKEFVQYLRLRRPDDCEVRTQAIPPFRFVEDRPYRLIVRMKGMPVAQPGNVSLEVWLESGASAVTEQHMYPISILHRAKSVDSK